MADAIVGSDSVVGFGVRGYGLGGGRNDDLGDLILSNQIGSGFRDTLSTVHDSSINVMGSVERNGLANVQETARNGSTNLQSIERNGGEIRSAVERGHGETRAFIDRLSNDLCRDIGAVRREASEHKAEITLEGCKNTHALTLQAAENKAALAAQLAECCCEIKELVRAENSQTRALINDVETRHVRDALADAKQALMVAEIKAK